jgi:hypothetical protein
VQFEDKRGEDGSEEEEEKGPKEGIEDAVSPRGLSL